ncbi:MAG: hypothetical protein JWR50_116 [Mucilaginibacter sp.]|nr:hypothetical protein [Mucilaginibacter sp.]
MAALLLFTNVSFAFADVSLLVKLSALAVLLFGDEHDVISKAIAQPNVRYFIIGQQ